MRTNSKNRLFTVFRKVAHETQLFIDPLVQPKVTAGRDNCFRTCCPSVPTFQI